ncbi:MAG: hypothetical protein EON91_10960 [Brevundimonas sp.]|uniref:hypothetical protein n=1 Tax=Brevundimonas sp. TaxID=1871086 RepID=UPI0011F99A41|nr:hypothetical protein [Brevundimonas sp.]RZJ17016.1 MAG: hypothetical protein EON91_10960 [Brevundimonas sp.]
MTDTLTIDALIADLARQADVAPEQARAVLAGALGLLGKHAGQDARSALFDAVPGAEALAVSDEARPAGGGGLFGGLMRGAGGLSGAAVADGMGLLSRLKAVGVDKDDLKRLLPVARERLRQATGRDLLGEAIRSVPGLGPMLGG